jgi:hypothetical protein
MRCSEDGGREDERTRGREDERTRGREDERTRGPGVVSAKHEEGGILAEGV